MVATQVEEDDVPYDYAQTLSHFAALVSLRSEAQVDYASRRNALRLLTIFSGDTILEERGGVRSDRALLRALRFGLEVAIGQRIRCPHPSRRTTTEFVFSTIFEDQEFDLELSRDNIRIRVTDSSGIFQSHDSLTGIGVDYKPPSTGKLSPRFKSIIEELLADFSLARTNLDRSDLGGPLWSGHVPPNELARRNTFFDELSQPAAVWSYWYRWYNSLLNGNPLDPRLQHEVSLIPNDDWEKGPAHIARLIEEIEASHIASTLSERIELAPSGRLTLVPQRFPKDRHLGLLIDTVRDALDLATSGLRNELPEDAYQVRLLRQTFARYGNDPQRIEMDFERARVSLIADIAADAIPASAPNRDLVQALSDAAGAIRDSDPEIARNRERLNRIRLGQVSPQDAARIAEVAEQVAEISEGVLRDDLLEDRFRLPGVRRSSRIPDPVVPLGAAERNSALEVQAAQLRLYSRLAKVWLYLKGLDAEEINRIPGTPTAQWVFGLASVIGLIVSVVK